MTRLLGIDFSGAQDAGRHDFSWKAGSVPDSANYRFRVTATGVGGAAVTSTALMRDTVQSVNTGGSSLALQLAHMGNVSYASVKALN